MISNRSGLFGKRKFVQIPKENELRIYAVLKDLIYLIESCDKFCYVVYHLHDTPSLDSYKKMGVAFNYFPDSLGQSVVTVRFSNEGKMIEEAYPMSDFIINPFELTEDVSEAMAKASRLVKIMDSGWENQVENGNLYSVSKLMED